MIKRFYNLWHITNPGEKEADKQLSCMQDDSELIYVMHSLRLSSRYHPTQMAGECDFVVLARPGIMIVEVKGGIIGYGTLPEGGTGYYRLTGERKKEQFDDPFIQVDGNADAVQKYLFEKGLRNIFVGKLVCFPECGFTRSSISQDALWHRDHELPLPDMIIEALEQQKEVFRENERRTSASRHIEWKELEQDDMKRICEALEPEFQPSAYRSAVRFNLEEADRRTREGLTILRGLDENRRLMIEGPPGSGKSTYALEIIARLCKKERLRGLYLCWNELLLAEMKERISDTALDIPPEMIDARLYFDLAGELGKISGEKSLVPSKETVKNGGMRECVKGAVTRIGSKGRIEKYDFIVIDEAQDIFDKGPDFVIKALLKVNNPLQNGRYFILYDDSQDYPGTDDPGHYVRTRDMFRSYAACYSLTASLRVNTGHGLDSFIHDAAIGQIDLKKDYGEDVTIKEWSSVSEAIGLAKAAIARETGAGGVSKDECLVLFTYDLLGKESLFPPVLEQNGAFELLTAGNYKNALEKIRYTTMLKAKGLERDVVILTASSVAGRHNAFQVFIGASRARAKVYLLVRS